MLADSLVENTITHFLHYLQTSACFLHRVTGLCTELYFGCNLKGGWVKWKSNLLKVQCSLFSSKITSRTSPCKSVNIYFLPPYFGAGNLGQSDKEPTHFLLRHKRCSHNYWELHWQKHLQNVWTLQVCNVRELQTKYLYNFYNFIM